MWSLDFSLGQPLVVSIGGKNCALMPDGTAERWLFGHGFTASVEGRIFQRETVRERRHKRPSSCCHQSRTVVSLFDHDWHVRRRGDIPRRAQFDIGNFVGVEIAPEFFTT
ncbi:unannotated protein [freshwater metagenome]|uniref:Unannotated protein n=1 Tax=freshwater metagenome TaxID=449393 RepID=A0A6J6IEG0_9ZZZZ